MYSKQRDSHALTQRWERAGHIQKHLDCQNGYKRGKYKDMVEAGPGHEAFVDQSVLDMVTLTMAGKEFGSNP